MKKVFAEETFAISQYFSKFAKIYIRELFDLVAFSKVNSREKFQI